MFDDSARARDAWDELRLLAIEAGPGRSLIVDRSVVPHPHDAGAYPSVGWPVGQDEDYRFPPEHGCRGVHVQAFGREWVIHVDRVHPTCDPIEHLRQDAPAAWLVGAGALGAIFGVALGRTFAATLAGVAVGVLAGAAARALDSTSLRPD